MSENSSESPSPSRKNGKKAKTSKSSVLSEEQKKAHHIASEQKRRENIRSEFDKIVSLTPTLTESENRSELNILTKSADYIDELREENVKLVELCRMKGINVPQELIYNGPQNDGSDIGT
ncbi:uncharacterized protein SPAPADRAFT_136319 [Spathaspora passalidarum NRRL Y-27907]|uniref:BHLH domain-containing protein n=1 Tax=Spathaspora passalidarum (strain NRRL Y-27907 / 11-Y1) TaxID=619300 RepID=G3ALH8_SPAPN|nr:uncharacterized protein SPAPADRAFT_136319 [Spathaspora passalidarum NRRL Y-27907]EGW33221.1 hypothetical protein SPAPADRAFT_136319 [Spathaspora passalidarum NRRL Y-27907]